MFQECCNVERIVDTVLFILTYYMLKLKKYQRKTAMEKKAVKSLVPVCKPLNAVFHPFTLLVLRLHKSPIDAFNLSTSKTTQVYNWPKNVFENK